MGEEGSQAEQLASGEKVAREDWWHCEGDFRSRQGQDRHRHTSLHPQQQGHGEGCESEDKTRQGQGWGRIRPDCSGLLTGYPYYNPIITRSLPLLCFPWCFSLIQTSFQNTIAIWMSVKISSVWSFKIPLFCEQVVIHCHAPVQVEAPVHSSNVMLYSKTAKVASRVGHKTLEDGSRVRYLLKTGEVIDSAEEWKKVHKKKAEDKKD